MGGCDCLASREYELERKDLTPLPARAYEACTLAKAQAGHFSTVTFARNQYSVAVAWVQHPCAYQSLSLGPGFGGCDPAWPPGRLVGTVLPGSAGFTPSAPTPETRPGSIRAKIRH